MANPQVFADRMERADQTFTRHVVDKVPLSQLAPELGISYSTAKADVAAQGPSRLAAASVMIDKRGLWVRRGDRCFMTGGLQKRFARIQARKA